MILFLFSPILIFRRNGPQYQYALAVDPFLTRAVSKGLRLGIFVFDVCVSVFCLCLCRD